MSAPFDPPGPAPKGGRTVGGTAGGPADSPARPMGWQGRLARWAVGQRTVLFSLESVIGLIIVTFWALLGSLPFGPIGALVLFGLGFTAHWTAIATGSHKALWAATIVVLGMILMASAFLPLPPLALTVTSSTALIHNEMIRLNHSRRRAEVDIEIFHTAGLTVVATAGLAIAAVALAVILNADLGAIADVDGSPLGRDSSEDRSWLWVPAAAVLLLGVTGAVAVVARRVGGRSVSRRWDPGRRIPPQPTPTGIDSGSEPSHS